MTETILKLDDVAKVYGRSIRAADGVSFDIKAGETLVRWQT